MKAHRWVLVLLLVGPGSVPALAAPPPQTPFMALEAELRGEARRLAATWPGAEAGDRSAIEASLRSAYEGLHDIRHHAAFGELWDRWAFSGRTLEVLYPASGAHLAPLEFVHRGNLSEASFTFTEIDPAMIPRLEANLVRLMKLGFYSDLTASVTPMPAPVVGGSVPPSGAVPDRLRAWIRETIAATGSAPPLEAAFAFRFRGTRVRLRLLLHVSSTSPGSTDFYRGEDLERADLVVTHDISFDPRENLAFLRSCIESACTMGRRRPLAVMMEDLARHPAGLDLTPFGIRAATHLPYGHAPYLHLPDGTRTEAEDGPPLYTGAVLLQPDLALWSALPPSERTALFNLVLLRDQGFDRRNVDLVGGDRVQAPAILDWYMGYAHRDIEGRDLRRQKGFLADLSRTCVSAVEHLPLSPLRGWLCTSLDAFRSTLERITARDGLAAAREAAMGPAGDPFLSTPEVRRQFQAAVAAAAAVGAQLRADAEEAASAVKALSRGRLKKAGCRTVSSPSANPTIREIHPPVQPPAPSGP